MKNTTDGNSRVRRISLVKLFIFIALIVALTAIQGGAIAAPQALDPFAGAPSFINASLASGYGSSRGPLVSERISKLLEIDPVLHYGIPFKVCWVGYKEAELVLGGMYVLQPQSIFFERDKICGWFSLLDGLVALVPPGTYLAFVRGPGGGVDLTPPIYIMVDY